MQEVLPEGGVIRKLWIGEADKYRDHLLRLDSASRHNRFGGGVSDDFVSNSSICRFSLEAVVHGFFLDGVMRGAAELRQLGVRFPRQAEAAISVEKPWQSHGVGSALLRRTLLAARNRGFRLCTWRALPRTGACSSSRVNSTPSCRSISAASSAKWNPRAPTPLSVMQEMIADGHGFATAMLDLQSRMLRA